MVEQKDVDDLLGGLREDLKTYQRLEEERRGVYERILGRVTALEGLYRKKEEPVARGDVVLMPSMVEVAEKPAAPTEPAPAEAPAPAETPTEAPPQAEPPTAPPVEPASEPAPSPEGGQ